jgi:hypothetical protein
LFGRRKIRVSFISIVSDSGLSATAVGRGASLNFGGRMSDEKRQKHLTYWEARFLQNRVTLQQAIKDAKTKLPNWDERSINLTTIDENEQVFLNQTSSKSGMLFGHVVQYAPGRHHHAIRAEQKKPVVNVVEIAPKIADEETRAEFLESILYFGVKDNHVVLLQSRSLRGREFETYLGWLLSHAEVLEEDDGVQLIRGMTAAAKSKIAQDPPSKVRIGTALFERTQKVNIKDNSGRVKRTEFRIRGALWDFLRAEAGGSLDKLTVDDSIDPESIKAFVEIRYRKKKDVESGKVMEELVSALRHVHEDDIRVHLPKTGELRGDKIYLAATLSVAISNGNVVELDLHTQMWKWLEGLLKRKVVG